MKFNILILSAAVICASGMGMGCRTVDMVSRHTGPPPTCEVHGTVMVPEIIQVSPGEIDYLADYKAVARVKFPHHGDVILSSERQFRFELERQVRDFVCPDCTKTYDEYWSTRRRR